MEGIEVVAIGNEVLCGYTVNTNAAYIGQELLNIGLLVSRQTALPDDAQLLKHGLQEALQRSQLVITTGGLGPTCDDLTRGVAADLFQSDFRFDEAIAADLRRRFGDKLTTIQDQATVPTKARVLQNQSGTAPGLIFSNGRSTMILLPGIPAEMRAMFQKQVIPYLKEHFRKATRVYCKRINLHGIAESTADALLRKLQPQYPKVNFGIYPGQGILSIQLSVYAKDEAEANRQMESPFQAIATQFSRNIFEAASGRLEEEIHRRFIEKKLTLSAAESCTGGSLSARLTQMPGASQYFFGSVVAYANGLKTKLLGVPEQLVKAKGAVSEEVVRAMLQGLLERTQSDYGVAVTGIAGPDGGTPEKPVGTVWCAVGQRNGEIRAWKLQAHGNRDMVIDHSVNALLAGLLELVKSR